MKFDNHNQSGKSAMRRHLVLLGAMLLTLSLLGTGPAFAGKQPTLMLVQIDGDGMSDAKKGEVLEKLKTNLAKYKKYTILDKTDLDLLEAMVDAECLDMDAECLTNIGRASKADQLLYLKADKGKLFMWHINVKTGKFMKKHEVAGDEEAMAAAIPDKGMVALLGPLPVKKVKRIVFTIESNVKDSDVFINGKKFGMAPLTVKLKPGRYTFMVKAKGFLDVQEKIQVAQVGNKAWKAKMKPVPTRTVEKKRVVPPPKKKTDDDDGKTPFYATWWFWTGVGVGVAAITATTIALAVSGDDTPSVGTAKFSIEPSSAQYDAVFYQMLR
jgi:hypothetical protein